MSEETWLPVTGYINYKVSCNGKIINAKTERVIKQHLSSANYFRVSLYNEEGVCKKLAVHRCVATAFICNELNLPVVRHINGLKTDNRVENLEWGSHKDNSQDMLKHGTVAWGERQGASKLSATQVQYIKSLKEKPNFSKLAREFGVRHSTISNVWHRKWWKRLDD
jgi:hypothetical protein